MKLLEERILKDGRALNEERPEGGRIFEPPDGH